MTSYSRRLPVGAELVDDGVSFRVWAPESRRVSVSALGRDWPLSADGDGYFAGIVPGLSAGAAYRFRLNDADILLPDPASRAQPEGPMGPSLVVDPSAFAWTDRAWRGVTLPGQVLMEVHIGTFTPQGTWAAAMDKLPLLKELGITIVSMMPVNDFMGTFGWGYDGVGPFAPTHLYGTPDDLRRFVDRAHALGLGVLLDVVYNHFGPDGNVMPSYATHYFSRRHATDWGEALNYDGPNAQGMRDLVTANAAYWIGEYHFDGLRLDATQNIYDDALPQGHIITALAAAARDAAGERSIIIVAENDEQDADLVRPVADGGYGLDGLWNDDFHHSAVVAVTGRTEAYYQDFQGSPQELIAAAKHGYIFQGQGYSLTGKARGVPSRDLPPSAFLSYIENHDQVANTARGHRLHQLAGATRMRALTALQLLMPGTPMLFQGQDFWSSAPFVFFADHHPELAKLVRRGRHSSLAIFPRLADEAGQAQLPHPESAESFERCKLDWAEREANAKIVAFHRDCLALRASTPAFATSERADVDGCTLGPEAFALRFFADGVGDRLILVNLGRDLHLRSIADPLAAPPRGFGWSVIFSSEDPAYDGTGTPPIVTPGRGWTLPGQTTVVLAPARALAAPPVQLNP